MPIAADIRSVVVLHDPDTETLRRHLTLGPVVVVGHHSWRELAGVANYPWGVVPPDIGAEALEAVTAAVAAGFTVMPPGAVASASGEGPVRRSRVNQEPAPLEALTPREREVLQRLAEGLPNRAIAEALGISDHTVKFHLASIFGKLGAGTRTEAVRLGLRQGLVTI